MGMKKVNVSVVIPVYNPKYEHFKACVYSLLEISFPLDQYEIIIIDDGSTNRVIESFINELSPENRDRLFIKKFPHQGTAVARNNGIKLATGDLVAFTDVDCIVDCNWLKEYTGCFHDPLIGGVGGNIYSYSVRKYIEEYCDFFGSLRTPIYRNGSIMFLIGANSCWRKDALDKAEGFSQEYFRYAKIGVIIRGYTDFNLSQRILEKGYRLIHHPSAITHHQHRNSILGRMKQFYYYGTGAAFVKSISLYPLPILGRYDLEYPPKILNLLLTFFIHTISLFIRPFNYKGYNMRLDQKMFYPFFDHIQRISYGFGFYLMNKKLTNIQRKQKLIKVCDDF